MEKNNHMQSVHTEGISLMCRVCGNKNKAKNKKKYVPTSQQFAAELKIFFDLDISQDVEGKHSKILCYCCYNRLGLMRKMSASEQLEDYKKVVGADLEKSARLWCHFDDSLSMDQCPTCEHLAKWAKGGYHPSKVKLAAKRRAVKKHNEPEADGPSEYSPSPEKVPKASLSSSSYYSASTSTAVGPQTQASDTLDSALKPPVAKDASISPVDVSEAAKRRAVQKHNEPEADGPSEYSPSPEKVPKASLSSSSYYSASTSTAVGPQTQVSDTLDSALKSPVAEDASISLFDVSEFTTPRKQSQTTSVQTSFLGFDKPSSPVKQRGLRPLSQLNGPLTIQEEMYLTKLIRIKLSESSDKQTVKCKTGGKPFFLKKIIQPIKKSSEARTPLKKKRAQLINRIRMNVSGNTDNDAIAQQGIELRTASKPRKKLVLSAAEMPTPEVSAEEGPALRIMLGLSWRKYALLKRFHRQHGMEYSSDRKEKAAQKRAQAAEVEHNMRNLEVWNETDNAMEYVLTPTAGIADLPSYVTKMLDAYADQDKLTWHDGTIPVNEIWVKLGGDAGGGTTKLMIEIANVKKSSSKRNTCVFTIAECKDTSENLRRLLSPYQGQIEELRSMTWRGKNVRLFVFGDYDFLTKLFGLSGAQGVHPCLYCTINKDDMKKAPDNIEGDIADRTLKNIQKSYHGFSKKGKKKKSKAKLHFNVIRKPVLDIELDHVCPPYLHILLGVVKKHHDMLDKHCQELDEQLAENVALGRRLTCEADDLSQAFVSRVKVYKKINAHAETLAELNAQARAHDSPDVQQQIEKQKKAISDIKETSTPLPPRGGPLAAHLENTLQKNRISPQAYHARSLVGNHCHKYLKPEVYTEICQSIINKALAITDDRKILDKARAISHKFLELNALFSNIHQLISHQDVIQDEEIEVIESAVKQYMASFRTSFPKIAVIPKQHLLEYHCVPWVKRWNFGMALLAEQRGEQCHAVINALLPRVRGIKNKQQQLKHLLTEHLALVAPSFQAHIPTTRVRRRKR